MRWKIYYADRSTFSDSDGPIEQAPGWGAILVAQEDPTPQPYNIGRVYRFGKDFYCWRGEAWGWTGQDAAGLHHYLGESGWRKVLIGVELRPDLYHQIKASAEADDYLPPRNVKNPEAFSD